MEKRGSFPQSAEVDAFRQTILKTAEELVVNKFPKRIVQLNTMLTSGKLTSSPSSVYQKINIPVPEVPSRDQGHTSSQSTNNTTSAPAQASASNGETGVSISGYNYFIII